MKAETPEKFTAEVCGEFNFSSGRCQILKTRDDSFSLRYLTDGTQSEFTEPMHSSQGAWSETLFVYEPALRESLGCISPPTDVWRVASIGLGLGYNEILAAGIACSLKLQPQNVLIVSFENQDWLKTAFIEFFKQETAVSQNSPLGRVHEDITTRVSAFLKIQESELKNFIQRLVLGQRLQLKGELSRDSLQNTGAGAERFHCLLFDAFSPESSPELWNEELLRDLLEQLPACAAIFASYASRTKLKKTLREQNFKLMRKAGFAGKREATFARRHR